LERNFRYLAVALTIAITVGSLMPVNAIVKPTIQVSDKLVHAGAYFVLGLSWLLSFKNVIKSIKAIVIVLIAVFLYGIVIEVLQAILTSYRQADYKDMFANLLGVTFAGLIFLSVFKKNK
jgi:VanZ family protein